MVWVSGLGLGRFGPVYLGVGGNSQLGAGTAWRAV